MPCMAPASICSLEIYTIDLCVDKNLFLQVTHSVESGTLRTRVYATATQETPIMLTQHIYWY